MNTITVICPNCGNEMVCAATLVGKQTCCPTCRQRFWVKKSLIVNKAKEGFDKFIRYAAYIGGGLLIFALTFGRALIKYLSD